MSIPSRRLPLILSLAWGVPLALSACATTPPNPNAAKYPPRPRGCRVHVVHAPAPDVKEWDDLGIVHVDCPLDVGAVQCLERLREEVCHTGGDLVYDVPKKPLRPTDQGMVYAGHAAHTKEKPEAPEKEESAPKDEGEAPEDRGPVQPLPSAAAPAADAGAPAIDGGK